MIAFIRRHPRWCCFLFGVLLALSWAAYTDHVWEDYFITYRASKNLAEGKGLVFQEGERLHTFTSPLGVLLPALSHLLAGRGSDMVTLWIFRMMGALAFGGTATLAMMAAQRANGKKSSLAVWIGALVAAAVSLESKSLDYATNGMETPFLLLGFAWVLWTLTTRPKREVLHLGAGWALLMWGRPDAFIYIGAIGVGTLLWRPDRSAGETAKEQLLRLIKAGLITTVLYGPWILWATWYYGTAVPHTVVAKGLFNDERGMFDVVTSFFTNLWHHPEIISATYLPPYGPYVSWPAWTHPVAYTIAMVGMLLWLWPRLPWLTRLASFVAFVGQSYILSMVGFAVPWYLPAHAFFNIFAIASAVGWLAREHASRRWQIGAKIAMAACLAFLVLNTAWAARQLKWQQRIVEWGNRKAIGEWLRENSETPQDTVFLEPLGYIGFFSQLKMLDFPGLSSPETVAARRLASSRSAPFNWSELIATLQPDWLVLRDPERDEIQRREPDLLWVEYHLANTFDVTAAAEAVPHLVGWRYLIGDAKFFVYRRSLPKNPPEESPHDVKPLRAAAWTERNGWGAEPYDSQEKVLAHAPSSMRMMDVPSGQNLKFRGGFGIIADAYAKPLPDATDGAGFHIVALMADGSETVLLERRLDPAREPQDRGLQTFDLAMTADIVGLRLEIDSGAFGNNAWDWTYWSRLRFAQPLWPDGFRGTWRPAAGPAYFPAAQE